MRVHIPDECMESFRDQFEKTFKHSQDHAGYPYDECEECQTMRVVRHDVDHYDLESPSKPYHVEECKMCEEKTRKNEEYISSGRATTDRMRRHGEIL